MSANDGRVAPAPQRRGTDLRAREPKAIHRALRVLEAVAEIGPGATAKEISKALDYPTATTYRLLNLLVQDGYLVRMPDLKGFALGQKVTDLAGYVTPVRLPQAIRCLLEDLRSQLRAGAHFVVLEGGHLTVADSDPLFPMPFDPHDQRTYHVLLALLEAEGARTGVRRGSLPEGPSGSVCLTSAIRDDRDVIVAAIILLAPTTNSDLGEREEGLLEDYSRRLTPLVV